MAFNWLDELFAAATNTTLKIYNAAGTLMQPRAAMKFLGAGQSLADNPTTGQTEITVPGLDALSATLPLVKTGGVLSVNAATTSARGTISAPDQLKLDGIGATANVAAVAQGAGILVTGSAAAGTAPTRTVALDPDYIATGGESGSHPGLMSVAQLGQLEEATRALAEDERSGVALTDANTTVYATQDGRRRVLRLATLTDNRSLTLGVSDTPTAGDSIEIERLDLTTFTLAIINGGPGAGTLLTFPAAAARRAVFVFDGTNWTLESYAVSTLLATSVLASAGALSVGSSTGSILRKEGNATVVTETLDADGASSEVWANTVTGVTCKIAQRASGAGVALQFGPNYGVNSSTASGGVCAHLGDVVSTVSAGLILRCTSSDLEFARLRYQQLSGHAVLDINMTALGSTGWWLQGSTSTPSYMTAGTVNVQTKCMEVQGQISCATNQVIGTSGVVECDADNGHNHSIGFQTAMTGSFTVALDHARDGSTHRIAIRPAGQTFTITGVSDSDDATLADLYAATGETRIVYVEVTETGRFLRHWSSHNDQTNIVFEGDSITAGTLGAGTEYPVKCIARVNKGCLWHNDGLSNATVAQMLSQYAANIAPRYRAGATKNLLVLMCCTNDLILSRSAADCNTDIEAIITAAHATGYEVMVCTVLPSTLIVGAKETQRTSLNALILAGSADYKVDLTGVANLSNASNTTYFPDGTHLSEAGARELGFIVATAINTATGL